MKEKKNATNAEVHSRGKTRWQLIFYGLVTVVAIIITVDVLIFSPPPDSPASSELLKNDDLLTCSLPTLASIENNQPNDIPNLYAVSIYSQNDSLKLDYCYPDTLVTLSITPSTGQIHPNHQIYNQTYLVTSPESEGIIPGKAAAYPELWIPTVICIILLVCLLIVQGITYLVKRIQRKNSTPSSKWNQVVTPSVRLCGFIFMITGLLSMSPIPKWIENAQTKVDHSRLLPTLKLEDFNMEPCCLLSPDAYGLSAGGYNKICKLKLRFYSNKPLIEIIRQSSENSTQSEFIYAADSIPQRFVLTRPDIVRSLKELYGPKIPLLRISLMKEYDGYYTPNTSTSSLPLPVFKVEVDNKAQDLYYFPSAAPTYYHYNSNTKLRKKIHSLKGI